MLKILTIAGLCIIIISAQVILRAVKPNGVTVARRILVPFVRVQILVRLPLGPIV